jgi:uncharacterized membrane protein YjgN (DUF898 family)
MLKSFLWPELNETMLRQVGEDPAAEAPAPSPEAQARYPVEFTAFTGEYFRIWIVNLALTLVTVGIYSAWAKVRKRRYIYSHTRIAGESFEYRAKPWPILKGRLIALVVLLAAIAAIKFAPAIPADRGERLLRTLVDNLGFIAIFVFAGPWVIVRAYTFNAYNTAYRNIRLRFRATYWDCLKVTIKYGWLLLLVFTYPWVRYRLVDFVAKNHCFGTTQFTVSDFKGPFVGAYWSAPSWGFGLFIFLVANVIPTIPSKTVQLLLVIASYLSILFLYACLRAMTINAVWSNIHVGAVRFESQLRRLDMMWLYVTNLAAIIFTLGLATPWAVIRTYRYRASKTTVIASGSLDGFVQAEAQQVSAAGEEVGELLDLDIGL